MENDGSIRYLADIKQEDNRGQIQSCEKKGYVIQCINKDDNFTGSITEYELQRPDNRPCVVSAS